MVQLEYGHCCDRPRSWHATCVRTSVPRTVESCQDDEIVSIATMRELFVHELSDAMSAEQQILKMLPELRKEALNPELTQALKEHEQETKQQIKNLEEVFKQIGEKPEVTT